MFSCLKLTPALLVILLVSVVVSERPVSAQTFGHFRPFVTSITPVVGPDGVVGGISVDANGVVSRVMVDPTDQLGQILWKPDNPDSNRIRQPSQLRKISLRRLGRELARMREANIPMPGEFQYLAGLQRIEYVFVDPQNSDLILAGPAEGWRVGESGFVVGESSGLPVIDLCDLLMALRTGEDASKRGMTCSMDATPEGMRNYADYLRYAKIGLNEQTFYEMGEAIGEFEVTFTGVASNSHYAQILIAADVIMKRLGMDFEPSPVPGLASYLEMIQRSGRPIRNNSSPRWWLASDYEPLLRDKQGLAWKIRGQGVKAMTSEDILDRFGQTVSTRKTNRLAQRWADDFTEHFQELSVSLPIFGKLRNCMDLAVVAALLNKYDLFDKAGFRSSVLLDSDSIRLAEYPVPKWCPPQIRYVPVRRSWIITLSGGIAIDGWAAASNTEVDENLPVIRGQILGSSGDSWWWD